ncbi:Type VI secretion system Rhs/Vgr-family protein [Escherichia coli]|uniref:Type VI secretion system Rhs/Vgr-family protein n=1 Tax=Escherichia coli TaxID=562 RepID=A0A447XXN3_ECOLX|nr:Type VI secretion system Rhs/Vgr-family protein [Escherichia coli]
MSGALGIKVDGDIVLESSSRISLKVSGSFVVIHSGGVDIVGPKINLNSGGSPGTPVPALQPAVLRHWGMRRVVMAVIPEKKMKTLEGTA